MKVARLLACLCGGAVLVAACASTSNVYVPSTRKCDPTGSSEERLACNR